ncbi:MAG: class I SAM-dependent methyltransferase [Ilumatobacteraceae bacterium]
MTAARPHPRSPTTFGQADERLEAVLESLEGATNYSRWIYDAFSDQLGERVLEVGAGRGTISSLIAKDHFLTALEPSSTHVGALRQTLSEAEARIVHGTIDDLPTDHRFDAVVLVNTLEHIEDDGKALQTIHHHLVPNGRVILWVPAFDILYGRFDHQIGHFRRYRRRDLVSLCEEKGFVVRRARYVNFVGFFAWLIVVRLLGTTPTAGRLALVFDRFVVPVMSRVERRVAPPLGQSLLVIGERVEPHS